MKLKLMAFFLVTLSLFGAELLPQGSRPAVYRFDPGLAGLRKTAEGHWFWEVPADQEQRKIVFDLDQLGIIPNDYDEIRILFRNRTGFAALAARLTNYPAMDQLRNWYSKRALPESEWIDQRFDLRMDDDGWWFGNSLMEGHNLELTLLKRYRRVPGEPAVRETEIAAIELIRRKADLHFDELTASLKTDQDAIVWEYLLEIRNRESTSQKIDVHLDVSGLKHFSTPWKQRTLTLQAREQISIPLKLSIARSLAEKLPPLYSERILPQLVFADAPPVFPLIGYRPRYVWATVPAENPRFNLDLPDSEKDRKELLAEAEQAVLKPFAVPPQVHPQYCAIFKPREMEALSFYRVRDRASGKDISAEPGVTGSYIYHHNEQTFRSLKRMAQAYRLTENPAYAEKIRDILLEYTY